MSEFPADLQAALAPQYSLRRMLGRGGMATVYLAYDAKHQREVAVKVLRPDLSASIGSDRFLKEIQIAARLTHPHILALYEPTCWGTRTEWAAFIATSNPRTSCSRRGIRSSRISASPRPSRRRAAPT